MIIHHECLGPLQHRIGDRRAGREVIDVHPLIGWTVRRVGQVRSRLTTQTPPDPICINLTVQTEGSKGALEERGVSADRISRGERRDKLVHGSHRTGRIHRCHDAANLRTLNPDA